MSFSFSQSAGTSGVTTITVSATSRQELESLVENYTLSNETKSLLMPIAQRAYVPTGKYISFKPSSFSFESSGGTGSLQVTSNDDWYINFGSWVYPNEVRGNGNTIVGIRVEANTGDTRSGSITGYCLSDSAQTASTSVSQVGSYVRPFLSVSPLKTTVNASGGTGFTLAVTSNQDWITYTDARWVTMNTLSGSGDGSISFEVGENATDIVRESNIYVVSTASSLSATSVIVQSAQTQEEPYIIVSPTTKRIGTSGGSFTVTVSSNTEWETAVVYGGQERGWIALDKLNGEGDDTVEVRIDPDVQESVSGRSAYISFYNNNEGLKTEVNISQYDVMNEIYYTSTDGNIVVPYMTNNWGANIVSNTYENGQGIIEFDGNVTTIPGCAFSGNTTLETIKVPKSVTGMGMKAFYQCTGFTGDDNGFVFLESITNNSSGITLYDTTDYMFDECKSISSVTIDDGVTIIPDGTFARCTSLTSVTIGDNVTFIGNNAFSGCTSLSSVTFHDGITEMKGSFIECPLVGEFVTPTACTSIGASCFKGAQFSSVTINNLTHIYSSTFQNNTQLKTLVLDDSVEFIGDSAFCNTYLLEEIYAYSIEEPVVYTDTFKNAGRDVVGSKTLHYPSGGDYHIWYSLLNSLGWTLVADL